MTPSNKKRLVELIGIASAATPGPWTQLGSSTHSYNFMVWKRHKERDQEICRLPEADNPLAENTRFISKFNPSRIQALLSAYGEMMEAIMKDMRISCLRGCVCDLHEALAKAEKALGDG